MMHVAVFDACAMIAYLKGEPGADGVAGLLKDTTLMRFARGLNVGEVYYNVLKASDHGVANDSICPVCFIR